MIKTIMDTRSQINFLGCIKTQDLAPFTNFTCEFERW